MCKFVAFVLIVVLNGASFGQEDHPENFTCPTWTVYNTSTNSCECGVDIHFIVYCEQLDGCPRKFDISVFPRCCMTLSKDQMKAVVGSCPFSMHESWSRARVPSYLSQLDAAVCGYTHRTGQLCGQCVNGTSPPVYSYYPQCVNCPAGSNNWAKYIAVSLLPTTLLFLGTVVVKFRATSPQMNGYIMFCQILASPSVLRQTQKYALKHPYQQTITTGIYFSLVGIWNLDFLRMVYPPFCLHPNATMLQVLSLDYITAAYPLVLIILTYTLVTLHYHNFRPVVWLWRPFLRCCIRFQRQWDIQNSLVDAFATFLLLSYVKFLSISFDILTPTISWDSTGQEQPIVLYYNGTVEYCSKEHLPYAILAVTVLLMFTVLPILLLCLYPCHCYQRFLNSYHLRSQALHTFMDAFQGCYKDGTNGTRDCRCFAAIYLLTRTAIHLSFVLSSVLFTNSTFIVVLATVVLLLSIFHPYKVKLYNQLDIFFFLVMLVYIATLYILQDSATNFKEHSDIILHILLAPIPIMYPLCLVLYQIWRKSRRLQSATEWIRAFFSRPEQHQRWAESLPRRVIMDETSGLIKRNKENVS